MGRTSEHLNPKHKGLFQCHHFLVAKLTTTIFNLFFAVLGRFTVVVAPVVSLYMFRSTMDVLLVVRAFHPQRLEEYSSLMP